MKQSNLIYILLVTLVINLFFISAQAADNTININLQKTTTPAYPIGFNAYVMQAVKNKTQVFSVLNKTNPSTLRFLDGVGFVVFALPTKDNATQACNTTDHTFSNYKNCISAFFNSNGSSKPYPNANYSPRLQTIISFAEAAYAHGAKLAYGIMNVPYFFRTNGTKEGKELNNPSDYATFIAARVAVVEDAIHSANSAINLSEVILSNEPDYVNTIDLSSGYIPANQYAEFIKDVRQDLNDNGLQNIKISGPGLSRLSGTPTENNSGSTFISSLGTSAQQLNTFDFHTWWNDIINSGATEWTSEIAKIRKHYATKPIMISEFASLAGKDDDGSGQWKYPISQVKVAGEKLDPTCQEHYHYPNYALDPQRKCMLPDLVSWGTAVAANIAQLYNSGASNLLLWMAEDESFINFPLSFGMVKFDGSLRPYYYLVKQINTEFPQDAYIVSNANDTGTAIYGKNNEQKSNLLLLIPNFSSTEKTTQVNNLPENAILENAIYYNPACFNGTAHDSNHWCKLANVSQTRSTIPAYAVALIDYSLSTVTPVITWSNPTATYADVTQNSALINWNSASTTYGKITYQVEYTQDGVKTQTTHTIETSIKLSKLIADKHYKVLVMATEAGAQSQGPAKTNFTTQPASTLKPPSGMKWYSLGPYNGIYYGQLLFTTLATGGSGDYQYTLNIHPGGTTHERIKNRPLNYNILYMQPNQSYSVSISVKDIKTKAKATSKTYTIQWT